MSATLTFARQRAVFLWVLFAIPALAPFAHTATDGVVLFKGQGAGVLVPIVTAAVAVAVWLPYRRPARWRLPVIVFLALVGVAWLYQVVRTQLDQSLFNMAAFVVPVGLALILIKPVRRRDSDAALLVVAYALLSVSIASLVFGQLGWMPDGFDVSDGGGSRYEWLQAVGIPGRWGGPFGSVNYASPIGGLLVIVGATQAHWHRWLLVSGGILILALGQGRTALFAVAAGLAVLLAWSPLVNRTRRPVRLRWVIAGVAAATTCIYVGLMDPTLNGRTPLWGNFLPLLSANPVFGVGDSGILDFVARMSSQPGFVPHTHVHSVLLDGLVRYGLAMAILTVAIFATAIAAGIVGVRNGEPRMLAVAVFVLAAGATETIHSWIYWSPYLAALVWVALASFPPGEESTDAAHERPGPSHSVSWRDV